MLKKTIHRPNHRERAQPVEREKWGVLEKHKVRAHLSEPLGQLLLLIRELGVKPSLKAYHELY